MILFTSLMQYGLVEPYMWHRVLLNNIHLWNVWMLWIWLLIHTQNEPPLNSASPKWILCIFWYSIVLEMGGWMLWNWNLPQPRSLLHIGSEPTSAAIFMPNWVAGLADQKQYVLKTPQEQQIINVTSVLLEWKAALC